MGSVREAMGERAGIATAAWPLLPLLLLLALPLLTSAEQECRLSADPAVVTAPVGSSALLSFRITANGAQGPGQDLGHGACEVGRATWYKTRGNERLASYDASTFVWLLSDSAKVRYGARVELSPGFVVGSGGGGSVWLRLLELRMEDAGILKAVSKPEVSPHQPVAGGSLSLRCVVHQGSPPISYSWLRGDASSGGILKATGVHTETWILHDAWHRDAFACEVSNNVGGTNTTMERSDVVTVMAAAPGGDGPSTQHYIFWAPVLIILMLIVIVCLIIISHRYKGSRQESAQNKSPPSPPLPSEDEYEALGQREVLYDDLEPTRVQGRGEQRREEPGHPSRRTSEVSKM